MRSEAKNEKTQSFWYLEQAQYKWNDHCLRLTTEETLTYSPNIWQSKTSQKELEMYHLAVRPHAFPRLEVIGFTCWLSAIVLLLGFGATALSVGLFLACAVSLFFNCLIKKTKYRKATKKY